MLSMTLKIFSLLFALSVFSPGVVTGLKCPDKTFKFPICTTSTKEGAIVKHGRGKQFVYFFTPKGPLLLFI